MRLQTWFPDNSALARLAMVAAAAAAAAFALLTSNGWTAAPLALALLIYAAWRADSRNEAFLQGFWFGVVATAAGIWWVWDLLPFRELGHTNPWDGAGAVLAIWIIESLVLAIPFGIMSALLWESRKSVFAPLVAAALWPVAEWGRMWVFALFAYGPDSLLGPHYSIAALGYALAENDFLTGFARLGGIYGLSALLGMAGAVLAAAAVFAHRRELRIGFGGALLIALIATEWFAGTTLARPSPSLPSLTFAALEVKDGTHQGSGPTLESYIADIATAVPNVDALVFPEHLSLTRTLSPDDIAGLMKKNFPDRDVLIVVPTQEGGKDGAQRSVLTSASSADGVIGQYRKQFLMPEVEYMPYLSRFIFSLIPDQNVSAYFNSARPLRRGYDLDVVRFRNISIGGLLCSDSISPLLFKTLSDKGARILIDAGNQDWFNGSPLLTHRLALIARTHAVENHAYVIAADVSSLPYALAPDGTYLPVRAATIPGVFIITLLSS